MCGFWYFRRSGILGVWEVEFGIWPGGEIISHTPNHNMSEPKRVKEEGEAKEEMADAWKAYKSDYEMNDEVLRLFGNWMQMSGVSMCISPGITNEIVILSMRVLATYPDVHSLHFRTLNILQTCIEKAGPQCLPPDAFEFFSRFPPGCRHIAEILEACRPQVKGAHKGKEEEEAAVNE